MVVEILSLDIKPKPPMKSSEFHRRIKKDGWVHIRTDGSHYIYEKNKLTFSVPYHGSKEMGEGLRKSLTKAMGLK